MVEIETERLKLTEAQASDVDFLFELLNEPGWKRWISPDSAPDHDAARRYVQNLRESYEKHGFGLCIVRDREHRRPIGICGLVVRAGLDHPDLGFALLSSCQGHGYATEAATAIVQDAESRLGLTTLLAITHPQNTASIQVLKKLGFTASKTRAFPEASGESLVYERKMAPQES